VSSGRSIHRPAAPAALLACLLSVATVRVAAAGPPDEATECVKIADDARRLSCFDQTSRQAPAAPRQAPEGEAEEPAAEEEPSYLSRLWELDAQSRRGRFPLAFHHPNYSLPFSYNSSRNRESTQEADPDKKVQSSEFKGQLSFKLKLWEDVLGKDLDLWAAYTQLFLWQIYNDADSAYFRDTNYAPEILLNFRTDYRLLGLDGRYINLGVVHQSNGRSRPLSRSWNRVVANFGFERDNFIFVLNTWYRIPEEDKDDDNPDIDDFMGYGQLNFTYLWRRHRFGLSWRNNLDFHDNRGAVQLDWSFPIVKWVSGHLQYFNGYGESLLDYDDYANRIGIGLILKDWKNDPRREGRRARSLTQD
jgi:phospholipase A1